ncbi:MAG: hypothetical protein M1834_008192 [Cirrosporium novae-zelandiae]|nr:MAG: hypothetical protein M1834_008192 [Cirrosporium novae-zelandiae]
MFIANSRRFIGRWMCSESKLSTGRIIAAQRIQLRSHVSRVLGSTSLNHGSQYASKTDIWTPLSVRFYATRAQRPKAKSTTKSKSRAAPKKTAPKKVSSTKKTIKSKPKIKAKAKAKPKAKAAPKRRKLTEKQRQEAAKKKTLQKIRDLKETALTPPRKLPSTIWLVVMMEIAKNREVGTAAKEAVVKYQNLTPEETAAYARTANQNKEANELAYKKWLESHTPDEIRKANLARLALRRQARTKGNKAGAKYRLIKDDRLVKHPRTGYIYFVMERHSSGDLKNVEVSQLGKLFSREWNGMSNEDKKKYTDLAARDKARYNAETKTVYG